MTEIDRALTDPAFFVDNDPHPLWAELRRKDPVHWTQGLVRPFWSITRYDDIVAAFAEPTLFSSEKGVLTVPSSPEMEQITPEMMGAGQMMIMTDPPLHTAMRRAFNRLFLPRAVGKYASPGAALVGEILDAVLERGECDFVVDVAARLPMAFICEIMGIPREDWPNMFKWGNMSVGFEDAEYQVASGSAFETRMIGAQALGRYTAELARQRRGGDGEDLLTVLGNARLDGRELTDSELSANGFLYIVGGLETTRNAISAGLLALIQHPAERAELVRNPAVMTTAIEEILRWSSPITHIARLATRDTELGGRRIRAGEYVALWLPSANRDEAVFSDPYRFDVRRAPNEHIAFGKGEHFCAGAHLARLELRLTLERLLPAIAEIELAGPVERLKSNLIAGIKHMPVRFTRTRAAA
ncbi:MAG TPA: cytochrome P450 [Candidatus Binataceae bacterium]|nr:cytochrome P450 [Candidatus Binataceae bacterium]